MLIGDYYYYYYYLFIYLFIYLFVLCCFCCQVLKNLILGLGRKKMVVLLEKCFLGPIVYTQDTHTYYIDGQFQGGLNFMLPRLKIHFCEKAPAINKVKTKHITHHRVQLDKRR